MFGCAPAMIEPSPVMNGGLLDRHQNIRELPTHPGSLCETDPGRKVKKPSGKASLTSTDGMGLEAN